VHVEPRRAPGEVWQFMPETPCALHACFKKADVEPWPGQMTGTRGVGGREEAGWLPAGGSAAGFFASEELLFPQGSELAADGILDGRDPPCGGSPSRTPVMKG
jgi:hypothetical protein